MIASPLEEMNISDLAVGTALWQYLKMYDFEFTRNPGNMSKLQELSGYLNKHSDPMYVIEVVGSHNRNGNVNNLDYLLSYSRLDQERSNLKERSETNAKELSHYE